MSVGRACGRIACAGIPSLWAGEALLGPSIRSGGGRRIRGERRPPGTGSPSGLSGRHVTRGNIDGLHDPAIRVTRKCVNLAALRLVQEVLRVATAAREKPATSPSLSHTRSMGRGQSPQAGSASSPHARHLTARGVTASRRPRSGGTDSASAQLQQRPPAGRDISETLREILARDRAATAVARALSGHGQLLIVGGAVRDVLLGQEPHDVDLMARGVPMDQMQTLLSAYPGEVILTGKHFGVLRYRHPHGGEVEIGLPRTEVSTGAGHQDFDAQYDPELPVEKDLGRRDFTCNAIAWDVTTGALIDPYGGSADIAAGRLRCVSPAAFPEDPLRILRGLRAHARHGLTPDETTIALMREHTTSLRTLSAERIGDEWHQLMGAKDPAAGLRLGVATKVISEIVPALTDQARARRAVEHLSRAADLTKDPVARCAACFATLADDPTVAARTASDTLKAMARPRREYERVSLIIQAGALPAALDGPKARVVLNRIGTENAEAFIAMRTAGGAGPAEADFIRSSIARQDPIRIGDLAIGGKELMEEGLQGPAVGRALNALMSAVLTNPSLNNHDDLVALVRR